MKVFINMFESSFMVGLRIKRCLWIYFLIPQVTVSVVIAADLSGVLYISSDVITLFHYTFKSTFLHTHFHKNQLIVASLLVIAGQIVPIYRWLWENGN